MPRRRAATKRVILPDPKYKDLLVSKFINSLMKHGKKSIAESVLYESFKIIEDKAKTNPLEIFEEAMTNVQPPVEVRSRRVGGATYQVPVEVNSARKQSLAIRWLLTAARKRSGKSMSSKLANEFLDAKDSKGGAFKKKEDTIKMAEANRAFSHYRW